MSGVSLWVARMQWHCWHVMDGRHAASCACAPHSACCCSMHRATKSFCSQEDGTEESDRLLAAGADRVVDEDSEHVAGAALAVDEEDDVAIAHTATGRHTNATDEVWLNSELTFGQIPQNSNR